MTSKYQILDYVVGSPPSLLSIYMDLYRGASGSSLIQDYFSYSATLLTPFSSPYIFDAKMSYMVKIHFYYALLRVGLTLLKTLSYYLVIQKYLIWLLLFYCLPPYFNTLVIWRSILLLILIILVRFYIEFKLIWLIHSLLTFCLLMPPLSFLLLSAGMQRKLS